MYKRVSIALARPRVALSLRVFTLMILGGLAFWKWDELPNQTFAIPHVTWTYFVMAGLLSIANIGAEAEKYRTLFGRKLLTTPKSFYAVLTGMAVGIWTPNRVGEVIGRMKVSPEFRLRALKASLSGSLIQGSITVFFGSLALTLFPGKLNSYFDSFPVAYTGFSLLIFFAIALVIIHRGLQTFSDHRSSVSGFAIGWFWGAMRYGIFCTQFALLLFAFGFSGTMIEAFTGIALLYIIQSYVPGSFLSELGVREALSVLLFSQYFENPLHAPLAAFCLWIFNIGLPVAFRMFYTKSTAPNFRLE